MRTAFMAGALMALGISNAHAKRACRQVRQPKCAASINLAASASRREYAGLRQSVIICSARARASSRRRLPRPSRRGLLLWALIPETMAKLAYSKSRGNPNAVVGNRKGLMLLTEEEMRRVSSGEGNVFDPRDSVMAAATIMKQRTVSAPKRPHFDPKWIRRGVAKRG